MMGSDSDVVDETYFESRDRVTGGGFDASLLSEPVSVLRVRKAIVMGMESTVTDAVRAMQRGHTGCIVVTDDGTDQGHVAGIFTERDVLYRVVDRGRNPADLPLGEVMTEDPEAVPEGAGIAWVLNKMAVGGFRHVPVVDDMGRLVFVVSVRDVVEFLVDFFPSDVLNLPPEYGPPRSSKREGA